MWLNEMFVQQSLTRCFIVLVMAGVWATTAGLSWKDTASQEAEQAAKLYDENKLDEALAKITSAQVGMPDSPELQYNVGNVLYKQGKFEDARAGYKVASQDAPEHLSQFATYNMGNASFKAGDVEAAIEAYVKVLLQDANDDEARFNLEIALRTQQAQDQQKQDQQSKDEEEQEKSDEGTEQDQQQKDEQRQQRENERQEQDADQKQGEDEQAEQRQPQELTKDQIEQILAALEQQEEQVEKKLHKKKVGSSSVEKDW